MNKAICKILGYAEEELRKLTFQDITHPDDLSTDVGLYLQLLSHEIPSYSLEKRYIKKDGSIVWTQLTTTLVRDSNSEPIYFVSIIEDITERKTTEIELSRLREMAHKDRNNFFMLSHDLMAIFDYSGVIVEANPALEQLLGYSHEEIQEKPFIRFVHPQDLEHTQKMLAEFEKTQDLFELENRYMCKDGSHKLLSWRITGVPEDSRIYAIARDITEIRQREIEIAEKKEQIAMNFKMDALGKMSAGIAHEINNPLTIVLGHTYFLRKALNQPNIDKNKALEICNNIEKMSMRITEIISGLRIFSRDGANDPFEFCSLKKILRDTLSFSQNKMRSDGIELQVQEMNEDIEIYCRPTQISQVLLNLLNNATDAVKGNDLKIISIEFQVTQFKVGIAVVDNGPGVPEKLQANIFQPFFTTKEVGTGTGLGLSISKGIIDAHDGELFLDRSSKNTRFVFLLPRLRN